MDEKRGCILNVFITFIIGCHASISLYDDYTKNKEPYQRTDGDFDISLAVRLGYIKDNRHLQLLLNKSQPIQTAWYGDTKFSNLTLDDFRKYYLSDIIIKHGHDGNIKNKTTPLHRFRQLKLPLKLDWRNHQNRSFVSGVKNQRQCGGCWAFSTVETVESVYARTSGARAPDLSVQEVIDCSRYDGCGGGDTCTALSWMVQTETPLVTNTAYPLTDVSNDCKMITNQTRGLRVRVKSYQCYNKIGREHEILQLLQHGPVSAAVDATTWSNYQGGIIQYHCGQYTNHAVQIVGYDTTGEVPFYIVRNSWGSDYGHEGYLYIKIGDNVCGIAREIATVEVYR